MNFNDNDSILYPDDSMLYTDDSRLRPPPLGNLIPGFPTPGPGPGSNAPFPGSQSPPPIGSNLNVGPPPNFTPSKTSADVKHLSSSGPQTKAVSPGSISFCLFKFTYIWETSGREYWAFLLNVDRRTVSGLRWFRGTWVFFGVDLRRIDSFVCYRSEIPGSMPTPGFTPAPGPGSVPGPTPSPITGPGSMHTPGTKPSPITGPGSMHTPGTAPSPITGPGSMPTPGTKPSPITGSGSMPTPGTAPSPGVVPGSMPTPGFTPAPGPGSVPGPTPSPITGPGSMPTPGTKPSPITGPGSMPTPGFTPAPGPGSMPTPGTAPSPGAGPGSMPTPGTKPSPGAGPGSMPTPGTKPSPGAGPGSMPTPGTAPSPITGPGPGFMPTPGSSTPFPSSQGSPLGSSNLNIGPPPNYTPSKNSPEVKKLKSSSGGPQTQAVSPGSISFCLYKFTYIWETNGRNYWAYLLNVDRKTASGFRWFNGNWVYFGIDLDKIDSFVCYRSGINCDSCNEPRSEYKPLKNNKKEYSSTGVRNVYTKVLTSIEVPEIKDDFIINYLGEVNGEELTVRIPCKQTRITNYRIVLELTYPEEFNKPLIDNINLCANESSNEASRYLYEFRDNKEFLTPLEIFNSSTKKIDKSLKVFSSEFTNKIKKLKIPRELTKEIEYTIVQEKIEEPWRIL